MSATKSYRIGKFMDRAPIAEHSARIIPTVLLGIFRRPGVVNQYSLRSRDDLGPDRAHVPVLIQTGEVISFGQEELWRGFS